jgi:hypothetical protein
MPSLQKLYLGYAIIFITLLTQNVSAQKRQEYVVLKTGDTVYCKIKGGLFGGKSYINKDGASVKITTDEVKEYYFRKDKTPFESKILPNGKPDFLAALERGSINLYEMVISNTYGGPMGVVTTSSTRFFYAQKAKTDSLCLIKSTALINKNTPKERRAIFDQLISDDKAVHESFKAKDSFSFDEIRKTVKAYNELHPISL